MPPLFAVAAKLASSDAVAAFCELSNCASELPALALGAGKSVPVPGGAGSCTPIDEPGGAVVSDTGAPVVGLSTGGGAPASIGGRAIPGNSPTEPLLELPELVGLDVGVVIGGIAIGVPTATGAPELEPELEPELDPPLLGKPLSTLPPR